MGIIDYCFNYQVYSHLSFFYLNYVNAGSLSLYLPLSGHPQLAPASVGHLRLMRPSLVSLTVAFVSALCPSLHPLSEFVHVDDLLLFCSLVRSCLCRGRFLPRPLFFPLLLLLPLRLLEFFEARHECFVEETPSRISVGSHCPQRILRLNTPSVGHIVGLTLKLFVLILTAYRLAFCVALLCVHGGLCSIRCVGLRRAELW